MQTVHVLNKKKTYEKAEPQCGIAGSKLLQSAQKSVKKQSAGPVAHKHQCPKQNVQTTLESIHFLECRYTPMDRGFNLNPFVYECLCGRKLHVDELTLDTVFYVIRMRYEDRMSVYVLVGEGSYQESLAQTNMYTSVCF